jgi:hypothetical protein
LAGIEGDGHGEDVAIGKAVVLTDTICTWSVSCTCLDRTICLIPIAPNTYRS